MADAGRGQQFEHGVEHAEAGAQHRNNDHVALEDASVGRPERSGDDGRGDRHITKRLRRQQHTDSVCCPPEFRRCGACISQLRERVVNKRMIDDLQHDAPILRLRG